jgi:hypothetical protein
MELLLFLILVLITINSILIGFFLFLKPVLAIQIQKRFYERINWRIEPISIPKEVRNTKLMGLFLLFISFLVISYIVIKSIR